MITVIHYDTNKDPDVYFGVDQQTEDKILRGLKSDWNIARCKSEDWPGQDNPDYSVHHWDLTKRR